MNQRRYRDRNSEKINKAVADIFKALDGLTYWDADCALSRVAESLKDFTTINGDVYYCEPQCPAEDEEDWAYSFFTPDYPTHYFIMECNFIAKMEEVSYKEWIQHLKQSANANLSENK